MPKVKSAAWRFFASVKLALVTLFILAATSIIGTLIQQQKEPAYYVQEYGANLARVFEILNLTDMYRSWWFGALLGLFAVNLIVCTIERLPGVWRLVVLDNLKIDTERLAKMACTHRRDTGLMVPGAVDRLQQCMARAGWPTPGRRDLEGGTLLFSQKGVWTRLGVYVVHLSVLIILVGAMTSTLFGVQAYVFLPEGRTTSKIFLRQSKEAVPLGFELKCDRFEKTFYANGMIKEFRSDLTIVDPKRETPYQKSIIVNDPLSYKGLTFYQGDAYPLDEFIVEASNRTTGIEQVFRVPPEKGIAWPKTGASFRIEELQRDQDGAVLRAKILFSAVDGDAPAMFWIDNKGSVNFSQFGEEFTISCRQLYSTLLLIKKDPGLWIVFLGCVLMITGLIIVLYFFHRRVWIQVSRGDRGSQILLSGVSNKHKPAFERLFQELVAIVEKDAEITTGANSS